MLCNFDPRDWGLTISAMPNGTEAEELGESVDGGGESSPREPASFEDESLINTVVGGDRGRESRGYRGCSGCGTEDV